VLRGSEDDESSAERGSSESFDRLEVLFIAAESASESLYTSTRSSDCEERASEEKRDETRWGEVSNAMYSRNG
jgi:hypothetical protein